MASQTADTPSTSSPAEVDDPSRPSSVRPCTHRRPVVENHAGGPSTARAVPAKRTTGSLPRHAPQRQPRGACRARRDAIPHHHRGSRSQPAPRTIALHRIVQARHLPVVHAVGVPSRHARHRRLARFGTRTDEHDSTRRGTHRREPNLRCSLPAGDIPVARSERTHGAPHRRRWQTHPPEGLRSVRTVPERHHHHGRPCRRMLRAHHHPSRRRGRSKPSAGHEPARHRHHHGPHVPRHDIPAPPSPSG